MITVPGRKRRSRMVIKMIKVSGILSIDIIFWCIFKIMEIKLIALIIEDIPAIWREKVIVKWSFSNIL